jgi:threonine/homoserine/homoserine lactone efflux protein
MLANLVLLWLAALPLMGSPGPATLSTAAVGASFGARRGLPWLAGIVAGTAVVLGLIATGVTAAILALPALKAAITLLAAGYILYLAWRIATAPPLLQDAGAAKAPAFPGGFLLAVANPKAFAAIGAVYAGHSVVPGDLATDAALKIAALVPVIVLVNSVWLIFGTLVARALRDPRKSRIVNVIFAVLLVASVALALL